MKPTCYLVVLMGFALLPTRAPADEEKWTAYLEPNPVPDVPDVGWEQAQPSAPAQAVKRSVNHENFRGESSIAEFYVLGQEAMYLVDGHFVPSLDKVRLNDRTPLARGKLQIQSEGLELYHRNMGLRPRAAFPAKILAESKLTPAQWVAIFNGKDLTGWKMVALEEPAPAVVEDGMIVLRQLSKTKEHTFVATEASHQDFILELELKNDPNFNSGILLRCVESAPGDKVRLNGYQVKIDDTPRAWTGGVFEDFGNGWRWLHDLADNKKARAAFKLGEWSHFRIECIGKSIKVWVNQVPTVHLVDEKYSKGSIAFKIHSAGNGPNIGQSAMRLRNIRVITENPENHLIEMTLPPRTAPIEPGKFDKPKPATER